MADVDFIKKVINHPQIAPFIRDDGTPKDLNINYEKVVTDRNLFFLIMINDKMEKCGYFFFHPWNSFCFEVHTLILPEYRGEEASKFCEEGATWIFNETQCRKIVTQVPTWNNRAYALAKKAGMKTEGMNEASFLWHGKLYDQYLMGIKKEN